MTAPKLIRWWEQDQARLERDRKEVSEAFPNLSLDLGKEDGFWVGRLPVWPFQRAKPSGVDALCDNRGLEMLLAYSAAHPVVAPTIFPMSPEPTMAEHSMHDWHVLPAGGLCLMQSPGNWRSADSLVDLLMKAAGWRIEYALMKSKAIEQMSLKGIVEDATRDHLMVEPTSS